jgi:hypothetical protein
MGYINTIRYMLHIMPRPKLKTEVTTLKMTLEVRDLWERCAAAEVRSLTNMFEVMVRTYAAKAGIKAAAPATAIATQQIKEA